MGIRDWLRPYPKDIPEPPDRNDNLVRVLRGQRDGWCDKTREEIGRANRAERERDHWKARAEHLASEKSEADMRYADTRWLLEGMARRASELRRLWYQWHAEAAGFEAELGEARGDLVLLSWLLAEAEYKADMALSEGAFIGALMGSARPRAGEMRRILDSAEARRESVADAAEGDEAADWVPRLGERVTGEAPGLGEYTGPYKGSAKWVQGGRPCALIGDEQQPHTDDWIVYADTLRPAPSEREGDKAVNDVVPVDARGDRLLKQLGPIIDRWNAVLARAGSDYRVAVHALKQPDRRTRAERPTGPGGVSRLRSAAHAVSRHSTWGMCTDY